MEVYSVFKSYWTGLILDSRKWDLITKIFYHECDYFLLILVLRLLAMFQDNIMTAENFISEGPKG